MNGDAHWTSRHGKPIIFVILTLVAAGIYLADVRPKVREFKSGGTSSGPYGPW